MAVLQLKTFADFIAAVREECGIQASDTTLINRIKRDINIVYSNILASKDWWWLTGNVTLTHSAYVSTGTATVTQGSSAVTLTESITGSKKGMLFSVDGYREIYRIESHVSAGSTLKLDAVFTGASGSGLTYKIWADKLALPSNLKETVKVWHDHTTRNLDALSGQEFRKLVALGPRNEGKPRFYFTGDYFDPTPTVPITGFPALSSRTSFGTIKRLIFNSGIPTDIATAVSAGEPYTIRITGSEHPSYNGDFTISSVGTTETANDTIIFTGPAHDEGPTTDTSLSIEKLDTFSSIDRYREMHLYPALSSSKTSIHLDFIKSAQPLVNNTDEPIIPLDDREVLLFGTLERVWRKLRNPEESTTNGALFREKLAQMKGQVQDSLDKPKLETSKLYLSGKRNTRRSRNLDPSGSLSGGGAGAGSVVSGSANQVAVFGNDGLLISSPLISTTELGYLDGSTSNLQTQINTKAPSASPTFTGTVTLPTTTGVLHSSSGGVLSSSLVVLTSEVSGTLPVANGGTGSTSFTSGSVAFSNGTVLTQDNSNLYWNDTDNFLGIGTNAPQAKLQVSGGCGVFTGYANRAVGSGPGLEVGYDSTQTILQSYNRTTGVHIPTLVSASTHTFKASSTTSLTINSDATITAASTVTAAGFVGPLTGNVTGNVSGTAATFTGNLSGDVSSVGMTTTIGALKVTNAMLAGSIAYSKLSLTGAILNADLAGSIALSKLANGTANRLVVFNGSGGPSELSLTASRALASDANGLPTASSVTSTEQGYLSGVTSSLQTQLDAKAPLASPTFTGTVTQASVVTTGTSKVGSTGTPGASRTPQTWIDSGGNAGVAGSPALMIEGTANKERVSIYSTAAGALVEMGGAPSGTMASPGTTTSGTFLGYIQGGGYDTANWVLNRTRMAFVGDGTWTTTSTPTRIEFSTVASGTATGGGTIRLTVQSTGDIKFGALASGTVPVNTTSAMGYYQTGSKFVIWHNDAGTMRYKYLDMSGTGVTWVHTTTAP